jgi:hypothetical protein
VEDPTDEIAQFVGSDVRGWRGMEMAVRGETEPDIEFSSHEAPCLQLAYLTAELDDADVVTVDTYQDDGGFGLRWLPGQEPSRADDDGIFRWRSLPELPTGYVETVLVRVEEDVIVELSLLIGGHPLLLVAGEAWENWDGSITWHRFDESVLAFTDPSKAEAIQWIPSRA